MDIRQIKNNEQIQLTQRGGKKFRSKQIHKFANGIEMNEVAFFPSGRGFFFSLCKIEFHCRHLLCIKKKKRASAPIGLAARRQFRSGSLCSKCLECPTRLVHGGCSGGGGGGSSSGNGANIIIIHMHARNAFVSFRFVGQTAHTHTTIVIRTIYWLPWRCRFVLCSVFYLIYSHRALHTHSQCAPAFFPAAKCK